MSHIICGILYIAQRSVHSFVNKIRVDFGLWKNFTSNKTVIFCFISVLECILPQLFWIGFRTRLICLKYKQVEILNSLSAIKEDDDIFWGERVTGLGPSPIICLFTPYGEGSRPRTDNKTSENRTPSAPDQIFDHLLSRKVWQTII